MKNKFLSGFLSGLAGSLLIFTVMLSIYYIKVEGGNNNSLKTGEATNQEVSEEEKKIEIQDKITKLEAIIDEMYLEDVDKDAFADGIYKGLVNSLGDPYSVYYTADEFDSLKESSSGVYSGIGATVSQDVKTGIVTIVKPFVGGPAYESGVLPGDIIYKVNSTEVTGMELTEVVGKMKGKEGSSVTVTFVREGENEPLEIDIKRRKIEVPTIEYEMLDNKIGYISILEFDEVTAEQFRAAIDDLEKQGQVGMIVDVRNNPGGLLNIVVDMLDRMLPDGIIVYTEDKNGEGDEFFSDAKEEFKKPLAVLINGNSASAAEIFAGAIQDYKVGTLVGTTSFGKGIVQSVRPLYDGTAIKITVSKYFTPNGKNIHGTGIEPDVEVKLADDLKQKVVIEKSEDNQLQKAIEIINKEK